MAPLNPAFVWYISDSQLEKLGGSCSTQQILSYSPIYHLALRVNYNLYHLGDEDSVFNPFAVELICSKKVLQSLLISWLRNAAKKSGSYLCFPPLYTRYLKKYAVWRHDMYHRDVITLLSVPSENCDLINYYTKLENIRKVSNNDLVLYCQSWTTENSTN